MVQSTQGRPMDFYSPFAQATIVKKGGVDRYPLWVGPLSNALISGANLNRVQTKPLNYLCFLQELSVSMQLNYVPVIRAVLTPPFDEARRFIDSDLMEWGENTLEVIFGYVGGGNPAQGGGSNIVLSPMMSGIILLPELQLGTDVVITINAQGIGGYDMIRQESGRTWDATYREIIKSLVETVPKKSAPPGSLTGELEAAFNQAFPASGRKPREGLKVDFSLADTDADVKTILDSQVAKNQGGETDWAFLDKMVSDINCYMSITGYNATTAAQGSPKNLTLRIIPKSRIYQGENDSAQFTLTMYDFDGGFYPNRNEYPILSVNSPNMAVFAPAAARALFCTKIKMSSTTGVKRVVETQDNPKLGHTAQGQRGEREEKRDQVDYNKGEGGEWYNTIISEQPDAQSRIRSEMQELTKYMGIKLEVECPGIPQICPGHNVMVRGITGRYSTKYAVFKVTHVIGPSGYVTRLEMYSNSAPLLNLSKKEELTRGKFGKPTPPANQNSTSRVAPADVFNVL